MTVVSVALPTFMTTMSLFAIAFFGASLLFPSYFLQIRGETTLAAGLLLAPQGLGAMVSMPIAGNLADRTGVGRIVMSGIALIVLGMAVFTQVGAGTSYALLLGALFVMGLGMGATMMPIMTAALQTLTDHDIARGSTLMNIVQQVAGPVGTAVFSVVLTSSVKGKELAGPAIASQSDPSIAERFPAPALAEGFSQAADSFGLAFLVGTVLIASCLVPAVLLPKRHVPAPVADEDLPPVMLH